MSTLNLKNIQLGDNPDPSKNFVLSVPAVADGTLSIKRQDGTNVLSIDATGKAVIPGVVGTVAQVGGIPTGQVVERGSNANGEYVRFADGTQICVKPSLGTMQTATAVGSIFRDATANSLLWSYPAEFVPGSVAVSAYSEQTASNRWVTATAGGSGASCMAWSGVTSTVAVEYGMCAIGRWF